jgi:hypothetical protein
MITDKTYLQRLLSGDWLSRFLNKENIKYLAFLLILTIVYVLITTKVEQKQREIKKLETELQNKRSDYVMHKSALFKSSLERELEKVSTQNNLGLHLPQTPHRVIVISENQEKLNK